MPTDYGITVHFSWILLGVGVQNSSSGKKDKEMFCFCRSEEERCGKEGSKESRVSEVVGGRDESTCGTGPKFIHFTTWASAEQPLTSPLTYGNKRVLRSLQIIVKFLTNV